MQAMTLVIGDVRSLRSHRDMEHREKD